MAYITIYSFYVPGSTPGTGVLKTVIRDSADGTFIDTYDTIAGGGPSKPPNDTTVQVACYGVDQYTYKVKSSIPYAYYTKLPNAPFCGYVPPTCDLKQVSFVITDETNIGANDGTANMFATSSYNPIVYYLINSGGTIGSNSTGYFTGLVPDTYSIKAVDANLCTIINTGVVKPYSTSYTHFKYRLTFANITKSPIPSIQWELRLLDMKHNYDNTIYPIDITGTDTPIIYKKSDENEDKTSGIITSQLTINLKYTGKDFTPSEFSLVPERSWKAELYKNGIMEFQGWLLPDEIQDFYADPNYDIKLIATDGLASLKGNLWGNGLGGNGYSSLQVQQFGFTQWIDLIKQCLDQLGYVYGPTILVSSLRYNGGYNTDLWLQMGSWSDILYDNSGNAVDTYTALELLLKGLKLSIIQHKGQFVLLNWNDLFYANNGVVTAEYLKAFYLFASDFSNVAATGINVEQPLLQLIGFDAPNKPINPMQSLNYDKPYNIEVDVNFNILSLLYNNPSFEIGAVQGNLPPGVSKIGTINAFLNYDPFNPSIPNQGANNGNWELRFSGGLIYGSGIHFNDYLYFTNEIVIDQPNKKVNLSLFYRPKAISGYTNVLNSVFSFAIIFTAQISGNKYLWTNTGSPGGNTSKWQLVSSAPGAGQTTGQKITDYVSWNSYSEVTDILPEGGIGTLNFRMYAGDYFGYTSDHSLYPPDGTILTVDIDDLIITLSDAVDSLNLQTGEKHIITAVTGVPQANLKQIENKLFTFPNNKRLAGNIFTQHDYASGLVQNLWNFALKSADPKDRLTATISRSIARNYSRPMYIFEGDIQTAYLQYFSVFQLGFYETRIFMPYLIELDCRNNTSHIIIIELSDADAQNIYQYLPVYQKNSRSNG
jgi:hypothetical protein